MYLSIAVEVFVTTLTNRRSSLGYFVFVFDYWRLQLHLEAWSSSLVSQPSDASSSDVQSKTMLLDDIKNCYMH